MVHECEDRRLEVLVLGGDGEPQVHPARRGLAGVFPCPDRLEARVVHGGGEGLLDRKPDDPVDARRGLDRPHPVQVQELRDGRLTRGRRRRRPERGEGHEPAELGREDAGHEAELPHPQRDGGTVGFREEIEEVEVVTDGAGEVGDLVHSRRGLGAHSREAPEEIGGPALEVVGGEDERGAQVADLLGVVDGELDLLADVGGALDGRQLDVDVPRRVLARAGGDRQALEEGDPGGLVAVILAAFRTGGSARDNARQRRRGRKGHDRLLLDFPFRACGASKELVHPELHEIRTRFASRPCIGQSSRRVRDLDGHTDKSRHAESLARGDAPRDDSSCSSPAPSGGGGRIFEAGGGLGGAREEQSL